MTDAQQALAQVREALAAGPTPGPWVTMPANAGVHCVARINAWESVPPNGVELAHDTIDAAFIAACHPEAIRELLAERDALRRQLAEAEMDAERYRWLRNEASTARKCDPMVCIYPLDEQDLIDGDRLDIAIDAAMGASNE